MKPEIIIICGPTCTGKTALGISLAKKIGGEIISADSMAIYESLDLGTAKPTIEERALVPHHLIDVVKPESDFSVSEYENKALSVIADLKNRGVMPIIVGGTGFYINSVLYKLSYGNSAGNLPVREKYFKMAEVQGAEAVWEELNKIDPRSAAKIHANDVKRVVRALEIYFATGEKKSDQKDEFIPRFSYLAYTISLPRDVLYERINARVDKMFDCGLVKEVQSLIDRGITDKNQCMQGIGYKEVYEGLKNGDLEAAKELVKLNSRRYAKRQITFFKRLEGLVSLPDPSVALDKILSDLG